MALSTPVLFLVFNRPDSTVQVFEQIKLQQPKYLYVAADGPRTQKEGEPEKCALVRKLVLDNIDWDCEVKTLFRDQNLGCGKAVSEAISWFFENVEEGIILEDDCLPDASFFDFSGQLLKQHRNNKEIMSISGTNFLGSWNPKKQSYFFGLCGIWGWATWKRAWQLYDFNMKDWPNPAIKQRIKEGFGTNQWYEYYYPMLESAYDHSLDSWDPQWVYTLLVNNGKCITPSVNLIKNIGFNSDATHTLSPNKLIENLPLGHMQFPLKHPNNNNLDIRFLNLVYKFFNNDVKQNNFIYALLKKLKRGIIRTI